MTTTAAPHGTYSGLIEDGIVIGRVDTATLARRCNCQFDQDPAVHDRILRLEDMSAVEAATFIAEIIANEGNSGDVCGESYFREAPFEDRPLFSDRYDFGRFVASHNWRDPVAMASLAEAVNEAAGDALVGRGAART
jgi:hypothetical protein